ncbi:MAG: polysaccharide pyruvyl transferase family protein [Thermoguttaceae bacterium]|nr:polysaccharide pyruvyl transferase family protein [Thermoguttaceae bacterium]
MILLHGTGTHNKGAELMAVAVLQHFRSRPNPPQFVVPANFGPYPDRARYGLWTLLAERRLGRAKLVTLLAHRSFCRKYGLVHEREIRAVLDASGFAFGDQHGPEPTERMADQCRRWKRQGKIIILLPQAFGPFSSSRIRKAFRQLVNSCDLVFPRDPDSYKHVTDVAGQQPYIHIAPDFTPVIEGMPPVGWRLPDRTLLVVPNRRMIDKTDSSTSSRYVPFLADVIQLATGLDLRPALLVHSPEDKELVEPINRLAGRQLSVLEEPCPVRLKGILAQAYAVVSSRFHALVGALSQAVPAFAIGWSHKYARLMDEFGCPAAIAEVGDLVSVRRWLEEVLTDGDSLRCQLSQRMAEIAQRIQAMWNLVDQTLGFDRYLSC